MLTIGIVSQFSLTPRAGYIVLKKQPYKTENKWTISFGSSGQSNPVNRIEVGLDSLRCFHMDFKSIKDLVNLIFRFDFCCYF